MKKVKVIFDAKITIEVEGNLEMSQMCEQFDSIMKLLVSQPMIKDVKVIGCKIEE